MTTPTLHSRRRFSAGVLGAATLPALSVLGACAGPGAARPDAGLPPAFDANRFRRQTVSAGGRDVAVRVYEGLPTVARPVEPAYQQLNLYIPEAYFEGGRVGRHDARSAPIFLPNGVGGYMPATPLTIDGRLGPPSTAPNAIVTALSRGFVVAAPGARGRTLRAADGRYTGKAPAAIVDLKAAVRWLRLQGERMPGNTERIVSNGTSAGGALSALLAASGNHADYADELRAIGAAPGRDDIFAASAYCPITNLDHADAAYEWQFQGIADYRSIQISMLDYRVQRTELPGRLDATQRALSATLRDDFVAYVNRLRLPGPDGQALTLRADGSGPLRDHIAALVMASAQAALDAGQDLPAHAWLQRQGTRVTGLDFDAYVRAIGRMKPLPAFDGLARETGENQLFGDATRDKRHFTDFSLARSTATDPGAGADRADARVVRMMNAMAYAADPNARPAPHWRVRHGTRDRDTALAIPVLLAAALRARGLDVDLALPWDQPHGGDYDLPALFDWIEQRVAAG